jgi:hypothetical protein
VLLINNEKDVAEHHLSYTSLLQYIHESRKDNGIGEKNCQLVHVDQTVNHGLDTDKSIPPIDQLIYGGDKKDS